MAKEVCQEIAPELSVSADTERQHTAWAALECIDMGMTEADALDTFGITAEELAAHRDTYLALQ